MHDMRSTAHVAQHGSQTLVGDPQATAGFSTPGSHTSTTSGSTVARSKSAVATQSSMRRFTAA